MKLRSGKDISEENMAENNFQEALDHVEVNLDSNNPSSSVRIDIFSLRKLIDPRLWLAKFYFLTQLYKWNDDQILKNVVFYLGDELWSWYREKCESKAIKDWKTFEEQFIRYVDFKGNEFGKQLDLDQRKIKQGENILSYLTDISNLCREVDPKMSVKTACYHVLKGLPEWLTSGLLTRDFEKVEDLWEKLKGRISEQDLRERLYGESGKTSSSMTHPKPKTERPNPSPGMRDEGGRARNPSHEVDDERGRFGRFKRPLTDVTCWTCHEKGHLYYHCPNAKVSENREHLN
jgi:hypothetical protein